MSTKERLRKVLAAREEHLDKEYDESHEQENIDFNLFLKRPEIIKKLNDGNTNNIPLQDTIETLYAEFKLNESKQKAKKRRQKENKKKRTREKKKMDREDILSILNEPATKGNSVREGEYPQDFAKTGYANAKEYNA
mgnify:CR=1 FL=1